MPLKTLIPAAQYLRMSTEDQPNSIPTQRDEIQRYAESHGFEIVATYADPGKSGLEIRHRPGLQRLLGDIVSGKSPFRAVLVYDVSRWGRFQDTDESAHYEFLCRRAGIPVHYCAEQFTNDNRLPNAIMKALKRTMAAEYSRELSEKIAAAHKRMALEGYHVGGVAGYGLRRMLLSPNGRKQVLQTGECKNLVSDRVVLIPGPKSEVECVRTIFKLAGEKKNSPRVIAEELNRRNLLYSDNTPWDYLRVYRVLKNERFLGSTLWGMRNTRLHTVPKRVPRSEWIIKRDAFPAIITAEQFANAQTWARRRSCNPGQAREEILDKLAKNVAPKSPSGMLRRQRRLLSNRWRRRFGPLLNAYELIGHKPSLHVVNSATAYRKIGRLRAEFFATLKRLFASRLRMVRQYQEQRFRILELDNRIRIAVYICRVSEPPYVAGGQRWLIGVRPKYKHLPALICLPNRELTRLTDFYFVTELGPAKRHQIISADHPWLAEENHLKSLNEFCRTVTREMENHAMAPLRPQAFSVVGDVMFSEDDPTVIIDGNEFPLNTRAAAIFKLLVQDAGKVVPRSVLMCYQTNTEDKELYLNMQIGGLRRALGPKFRDRIVTVRHQGYMYRKVPTHGTV